MDDESDVQREIELRFSVVRERYADRLTSTQLDEVRRGVEGIVRALRALRAVRLQNADEPFPPFVPYRAPQ
ncbi:MAG: hypothetical protein C5B48_02640 [Candidatus Rokuibacteriota bacterium]|nr:MAG: hypothetical protein C5B48_02640 [Candidatus Rokubacteria bacterium]